MTFLHPLCILIIFLTAVNSEFLWDTCDTKNNFTVNGTYEDNLKQLEQSLLSSIVPSAGFYNTTVGNSSDQVFGLALCRGDVSTDVCQTCVGETITEAQNRCPNGKNEAIWYEQCLLHYSDTNFFSELGPLSNHFCNPTSSPDPQFNNVVARLMNTLASQAANISLMFAAGFINYMNGTDGSKLYGLVQCTRDISKENCSLCLHNFVIAIPAYCSGAQGGRFTGTTCSIRYEFNPFYNTSAVPNAASSLIPNTTTAGGKSSSLS